MLKQKLAHVEVCKYVPRLNFNGNFGYLEFTRVTIQKNRSKKKDLAKEEKNYNKQFSKERIICHKYLLFYEFLFIICSNI